MRASKSLHLAVRIGIVALFAACFLKRAPQPAVADDVDFLKPLEWWIVSGPQKEGLWHSPVYVWLLMWIGRAVRGASTGWFRSVGGASALFSAACIYLAAIRTRPDLEDWRRNFILALALLSPFALGSSLILDYDTTLLVAATSFYFCLLAFYASSKRTLYTTEPSFVRDVAVFGGALGVCLLAKETTPLAYPLGYLLVAWQRLESFSKAAVRAVAGAVVGVALFLGVSWLWCRHYGLPLSAVFEMDILGFKIHGYQPRESNVTSLGVKAWMKLVPLFWLGLPLSLLFFKRLPMIFRAGGATRAIGAVTLFVLFVYTFVLAQGTYHFPKYMSPVFAWIPFLLLVPEREDNTHSNMTPENFKTWVVVVLLWFLLMPIDPLHVVYDRNLASLGRTLFMLAVPLVIWVLVRYLHVASWLRGSPRPSTMAVLLTTGLALAYCRSALFTTASITYWYGDSAPGEARTVAEEWIANNPHGVVYAPAKDVAWNIRDLHGIYLQRESLGNNGAELCSQKVPFLVVTRIREDSSLLKYEGYGPLRQCLGPVRAGVDIVSSASYPRD